MLINFYFQALMEPFTSSGSQVTMHMAFYDYRKPLLVDFKLNICRGFFVLRKIVLVHSRNTIFVGTVINNRSYWKITMPRRGGNSPF
jgi:hypothetical protein